MIAVVRTGVFAGVSLCAALIASPSFAAPSSAIDVPVVPTAPVAPVAAAAAAALNLTPAAPATTTMPAAAANTAFPAPVAAAPALPALAPTFVPATFTAIPTTTTTAPVNIAPAPRAAVVAPPLPAPTTAQAAGTAAAKPLAPTVSLHDLVISYVDRRDQDAEGQCLAQAVFFEARGESLEGQLAVAQVVLNRAASGTFPSSICQVVTQPAQFSFVRRGKIPEADRTSECWHKALAIADVARKRALAGEVASNVLWYHATYVSPSWGRQKTRFAQIGSHIFYS